MDRKSSDGFAATCCDSPGNMSGYTPVFRTVFEGSLCGQYPDTAAWLFMLALADKNGHVDKTPQYISAVTGMPVDELLGCLDRFMQPDPSSRSPAEDGRRLVPIDAARSWGWRVVNHAQYRERARLAAKNAREVDDGRNRDRMQDRRRPPVTAGDRPSNSNANANAHTDAAAGPTRVDSSVTFATYAPQERDSNDVQRVFDRWKEIHGHPKAKLDSKRRKLVRDALMNYSADDLCEAIHGYKLSPYHQGDNQNGTKYDAIELILRDAQHIDAGLEFAREPPSGRRRTRVERAMDRLNAALGQDDGSEPQF